jgi:hypothetical protein
MTTGWQSLLDMVRAFEPAPEPVRAPAPPRNRTRYMREYQRRRRGFLGRTYVQWPADYPENKRETLRRTRDRRRQDGEA